LRGGESRSPEVAGARRRLKELETLEKVTEKIDKLTVFGGLEGVLKDVVRIRVPEA
jgi:NCAIR mutase (PurE)-related protein